MFIGVEPFGNGARPVVRLTFRADRTHEVGLATFAAPGFTGDGFARRIAFLLPRLPDGSVLVKAMSDEADPAAAEVIKGWRYVGRPAVQAWRCERPEPGLEAAVNARARYWRRQDAIPGGPAIENFELSWPFRDGQEVWFVVEPLEKRR